MHVEPLLSTTAAHLLRANILATQPELSAVLRDGRILAAEVLRTGDGSVLLAVGRHRVPAETNVHLEPGQKFLFRVHQEAAGVVLQVLGAEVANEPSLLTALRGVISEDRPIGDLLSSLAVRIRADLASAGDSLETLRSLLASLGRGGFRPGTGGGELLRVLQESGLRFEAALFAALHGGLKEKSLQRLSADLKHELLAALRDLPEGGVREAVAQTVLGLEAEQLLNVARQRAGEPWVWSFPVLDGDGWTTARLILPPRDESSKPPTSEEEESGTRLVLGVSFQNTGPVRAEITLGEARLSVRFLVSNPDVADRLWRDFPRLSERLGTRERPVHLFAKIGSPEEVAVPARRMDIGFLRDHRLMDVSG